MAINNSFAIGKGIKFTAKLVVASAYTTFLYNSFAQVLPLHSDYKVLAVLILSSVFLALNFSVFLRSNLSLMFSFFAMLSSYFWSGNIYQSFILLLISVIFSFSKLLGKEE